MDTFAEYLQGSFTKLKGLKVNMVATVKKDRIYNREAQGNFQMHVLVGLLTMQIQLLS